MNTMTQIKISKATDEQRPSIIALLQSEKLPVEDLPISLDNFLVAREDDAIIGVIGLKQYEHYGLLRSMVVDKAYRNQNIASQLVKQLETHAITLGIAYMCLLTETASQYFERKSYKKISRDEVPELIRASSEFSYVCPVSATIIKKRLTQK